MNLNKYTQKAQEAVLAAQVGIRCTQRVTSQNPEATYEALQKYGRVLMQLAQLGKLDPVIGRDEEIRRVIQVLSRRTKSNPVLIGEAGEVGEGDRVVGDVQDGELVFRTLERQAEGLEDGG